MAHHALDRKKAAFLQRNFHLPKELGVVFKQRTKKLDDCLLELLHTLGSRINNLDLKVNHFVKSSIITIAN